MKNGKWLNPKSPTVVSLVLLAILASHAIGVENVTVRHEGREEELVGKVEVEDQEGRLLFLTRAGELRFLEPDEIIRRESDDQEFKPLSKLEVSESLLSRLPKDFKTRETAHYLIAYNTSEAYAEWIGQLYERLHDRFYELFEKLGIKLEAPRGPLVVIVFDRREDFLLFSRSEIGQSADNIIGYYSLRYNWVALYDLTGIEAVSPGGKVRDRSRIQEVLAQPAAERNVATIVHEATHQLAFNSGLMARYADVPKWVSEGLAMYFESPDPRSQRGWQQPGRINYFNLAQFRADAPNRKGDWLKTLQTDDIQFNGGPNARKAYGEAWVLTYFLFKTRHKKFAKYLSEISRLPPGTEAENKSHRLKDFSDAMGEDLKKTEAAMMKFVRGLK